MKVGEHGGDGELRACVDHQRPLPQPPPRRRGGGGRGVDQGQARAGEEAGRRVQVAAAGQRDPERVRGPARRRPRPPPGPGRGPAAAGCRRGPCPRRPGSRRPARAARRPRRNPPDRTASAAAGSRRPGTRRGKRRSSRSCTGGRARCLRYLSAAACSPGVRYWRCRAVLSGAAARWFTGGYGRSYGFSVVPAGARPGRRSSRSTRPPARCSPATRSTGREEVALAVRRARGAAAWWGGVGFAERRLRLLAWKSHLTRYLGRLAQLVHEETGKPLDDATLEIVNTILHLDWAARHAAPVLRPRRVASGHRDAQPGVLGRVPPARRDRRDRAVELPGVHPDGLDRLRPRGGQRGRVQALRADHRRGAVAGAVARRGAVRGVRRDRAGAAARHRARRDRGRAGALGGGQARVHRVAPPPPARCSRRRPRT